MTLQLFYVSGSENIPLPLPDAEGGVALSGQPVGASRRAWNGTLTLDYVATKRRIELHWGALTAGERDAVLTAWAYFLAQSGTVNSSETFMLIADFCANLRWWAWAGRRPQIRQG